MRLFFADEDGQATTEYILILAVLISLAILLIRDLIRPIMARFTDDLSKIITERLFKNGGNMHRSPFRAP
jgi:Flp pilus assembly pilin Flp